jgi:uncharacterized repeat protein (TIGR01451 family)
MRAVEKRRGVAVVGVFLLVALSAGATSVLANGGLSSPRGRGDVPVPRAPLSAVKHSRSIIVGHSAKNDVSRPLRAMPKKPFRGGGFEREASPNPRPVSRHEDAPDGARQAERFAPNMPSPTLNFDGIAFPGVSCFCAPPDTNGEVGATQYVQMVNTGFQVFNKTTGASLLGPLDINTVWDGFGGVCEGESAGDPVVVYDQLADRWLISQFAGQPDSALTDECIAVSTTSDATGSWNRYDFELGSDFFDYPKLGVWPDAYYMSANVFDEFGTAYLGPQPFAFDRAAMLAGTPATFVTTRNPSIFNPFNDGMLPADLDGSTAPPANAPEPFLMSGTASNWLLWRFHADFGTPANSTFALGGTLTPAAYSVVCPTSRNCIPQLGTTTRLDGIGDRGMFRLAYRNFGDHEALVGNQTVSSGGVAGIRWYEIGNATSGTPAFVQQSTYQPDTTWRWMGSAAMDRDGNLAVGFSASSAAIHPQIRYAGRLALDFPNNLADGEATLFAGPGSQTGTGNRWGDYSDLTIDPVDECTFWYTQEYYATTSAFNWRTRVGSFKFPSCNNPNASLAIRNTTDAAVVNAGGQIGFTVALINAGGGGETNLAVTDNLPSGAGINWVIDLAKSDSGWSVSGLPPNQTLAYTSDTLAAHTAVHAHVVSSTSVSSCGTYNSSAGFSGAHGLGNAAASTTVQCSPSVSVVRAGAGSGTVVSTPAGISCGTTCSASFPSGTPMTLSATAATGSTFTGWSGGGCAGTGVCTFVVNGPQTITATFALQQKRLSVTNKGNGRGTVTSSPTGVGCGVTCSASFSYGTAVTLTAKPTANSVFGGWSGACSGKSTCPLSMTVDRAATATFRAKCLVPKVLGLTLKKARARIKRAHCIVGKITRKPSVKRKRGKVLAQKPKPGKRLAPGARVSLTVGRR